MEENNFQREENSQRRKEALEGKWGDVEEQLWIGNFIRIGFFLFCFLDVIKLVLQISFVFVSFNHYPKK